MGIKKLLFKNLKDEYVVFKKNIYRYHYSNGVNKIFSEKDGLISDFLKDERVYNEIINSDFNKFDVIAEDDIGKYYSREYLIKCFQQRKNKGYNEYYTYKVISPQDVTDFYQFGVWVEIAGVRIVPGAFDQNQEYPGCILLPRMEEKLKKSIPYKKVPTPMDGRGEDYLISDSYIDKVIGVKRCKDINWIGTGWEHYDDFTSETEEYVLDLHHFDQDIYRIFKEHNALEILR